MSELIICKNCELYNTKDCYAVKAFKGVVLTPDSGCTYGKPKGRPQ